MLGPVVLGIFFFHIVLVTIIQTYALRYLYTGCIKKKLNKPEIAHRFCKAPQYTKFFIEIGCLGTNNVVQIEKLRDLKF